MVSHHGESKLARENPRLDITDVYVFRGSGGTVLVMNVNPGPGGFHSEGRYEFRLDTDGDAIEDQTLFVTFGEHDADGRQALVLSRLDGEQARDRDSAGVVLARGRTDEEIDGEGGVRIWAGSAADPFYINGAVLGAVMEAVANGTRFDLSGVDHGNAANAFAGANVCAIVIEIPDDAFDVTEIGFWGTTALATDSGRWRQINRCAHPLASIFNPLDSDRASAYNLSHPSEDRALYGPLVTELITKVVAATKTSADPAGHARRVVNEIFPDLLRYELGTTANFGFPVRNGRGLTDCVPEVMFALILNKAVPLGLDSTSADGVPRATFPYVAPPV
jgi:hypothetical protein